MMYTYVLAGINLIWNFPVFLYVILDIYLSYRIAWSCVIKMLVSARPNRCWCPDIFSGQPVYSKPVCDAKLHALEILLIILEGLALAIA